jgi:type I restriction enzyme S subunit
MQEKYKSMSNVPNLRFPEFTGEWEVKKLGEITSWSSGGTPPKDNPLFWNGDIPWISASSMRGIVYSDSELKITNVGLIKGSKLARKGTLLILVRGSMLFNKIPIGIVSKDVAFNQDVKSIVVNDYSTSEYILNWFIAFEPKILNMVTGTGIGAGKLDLLDLKALEIKIPFRHEQQKIASFFSLIHERIQTQSKIIEESKILKATLSKKIFTQQLRFKDEGGNGFPDWEVKKLGEVCEIVMGQSPSSISYNTEEIGIPLIQGNADIFNRITSPRNWTTEITKKCLIGDLILTVRAPVGAVAKSAHNACIGRGVCGIRGNSSNSNEFIYQFLLDYEDKWNKLEQGSTFTAVSGNEIKKVEISIPSIKEQTKSANFLSSIDKKIEVENLLLKQLETKKKYLLSNLFI